MELPEVPTAPTGTCSGAQVLGLSPPTQYAGGQGRLLPLQADACQAGALPGPGRGNAMSLTALFRVFI